MERDTRLDPGVSNPFHTSSQTLNTCSIVETNVGIICGCMPHLASVFRQLRNRLRQSTVYKSLKSRATSMFTRHLATSKGSSARNQNFERVSSKHSENIYLETNILGSARGKGKFLDSGNHPQQGWLQSNVASVDSTLATRRDAM